MIFTVLSDNKFTIKISNNKTTESQLQNTYTGIKEKIRVTKIYKLHPQIIIYDFLTDN